jgi:hypothetical protein
MARMVCLRNGPSELLAGGGDVARKLTASREKRRQTTAHSVERALTSLPAAPVELRLLVLMPSPLQAS